MQEAIFYKNTKISFSSVGNGSVVVLLHGFLENSTMWNSVKEVLFKNHRIVCIDLLGHGETECLGYVHSMELMAEAVAVVLKHLKIRKSVVVGHSLGGYVALALVEKYPDQIQGLCLMNATARADNATRLALRNRAIEAVKRNYANVVRMSISNLFMPKNSILFRKEIETLQQEALQTSLQGYIAAQEGMKIRNDRTILLRTSSYKKMMILGREDPVMNCDDVFDQIKNTATEVVEFPGGHMPHIENKEALRFTLKKFVKDCYTK